MDVGIFKGSAGDSDGAGLEDCSLLFCNMDARKKKYGCQRVKAKITLQQNNGRNEKISHYMKIINTGLNIGMNTIF